jgi:hypothetical protein
MCCGHKMEWNKYLSVKSLYVGKGDLREQCDPWASCLGVSSGDESS